MTLPNLVDVLVVGAGPTGLAAAISLILQGCGKVIVVDRLQQGQNTSRAAVILAHTLEVLECTGAVPMLLQKGFHSPKATIYEGESILLEVPFNNIPSKYNFVLMISQADTEKILLERLNQLGGTVFWSQKVISMNSVHETLKEVKFESGEVVRAGYIIAADGLHSVIRKEAGIPYTDPTPGRTEDDFIVQLCLVDVRISPPLDPANGLLGHVSSHGMVGMIPLPDSIVRMFAIIPKTAEVPRNPDLEFVQGLLKERSVNRTVESVIWGSRFRVRSRIADTFFIPGKNGEGAVLLAGDAAHTHSPAGGQGMNLGLCDAVILADAIKKHMETHDDEVLMTYSRERKKRALKIIAVTERLSIIAGSIASWKIVILRWVTRAVHLFPAIIRAGVVEMSGISHR